MEEALEADLQDAEAAVHDEHQRRQQEGERVAALEGQDGEEEAHGTAAGVAHQEAGGLCIGPQVGQQCADKDDGSGGVAPQLLAVSQQEGADAHHREAGGQAVHAVGAVDHIDAGPDEDDDEQQVERIGNGESSAQEVDARAVEVQVGNTCHHGDDEVDEALLVLVPRRLGGVVKVARQHGGDEQNGINKVLHLKRHHRQRHQRDAEHEDESGTPGLALGELAVDGEGTAMVVGELVVEDRVHQGGQGKRQQERQRVHGLLAGS